MCDDFKGREQEGHFKDFFGAGAEEEAWSVHSRPTSHACPPLCIPDAMKREQLRVNRGDGCGNAEQGTQRTRLRAGASYRGAYCEQKCQPQGRPPVPLATG